MPHTGSFRTLAQSRFKASELPLAAVALACLLSPWRVLDCVRVGEQVRPVILNLTAYKKRLLGLGGTQTFRAWLRNGPVIEFPEQCTVRDYLTVGDMIDEVWHRRVYTPQVISIEDGDSIVDLGANIGVFTLYASYLNPHGRVIAYEPQPETFGILKRNITLNDRRNIEPHNAGVSDRMDQGRLWYHEGNVGGHSLYSALTPGKDKVSEVVNLVSLDHVVESNSLDGVGLLKIDCEGSEYRIISGASEGTLRRIRSIAMEYHLIPGEATGPELLKARLEASGFKVNTAQNPPVGGLMWATRKLQE